MLGSFKKAPKIEFFTNIDMLPEVIPVVHGAKAMPSWWKQTPAAAPNTDLRTEPGTVKVCKDFMRVMQKSQLNLMTKFRRGYRHFTD